VTCRERDFQQQILDLAGLYGWALKYHTHDSRHSAKGWPDLVLCRPPEILFVEIKTEKGKISPAQSAWLEALRACGLEALLWRPSDWDGLHARLARKNRAVAA